MNLKRCGQKGTVSCRATVTAGIATLGMLLGSSVFAHHGPPIEPFYNTSSLVELDGAITEIFWRNPHVRFRIRAEDGEIWELETDPIGMLARRGVGPELLQIGDQVRVAGRVSNRNPREMALMNLLLPNGEEFTGTAATRELRFSESRVDIRHLGISAAAADDAERRASGIFRVWARGVREFGGSSEPDNDEALLTDSALEQRLAFDALTDEPVLDCVPEGMPRAMLHPTPIEFIDQGETIVMRIHEHDLTRVIHLSDGANAAGQPLSPLGYSIGRWDNDRLIVTTSRLSWPLSDEVGTPQTPAAELVETFVPADDHSRLDYELRVTDPPIFTQTSVRTAHWIWVPGLTIEPFECTLWTEPLE
jgi:hypothetical protein